MKTYGELRVKLSALMRGEFGKHAEAAASSGWGSGI